jgi:hypothetical protein
MRQPRWRKARREALAASGITPTNRNILWIVALKNYSIVPTWVKDRALFPRNSVPGQFWLKHMDAIALTTFARSIHVSFTITKTEFRRCPTCHRPTVGSEAVKMRQQMESSKDGRTLPCGPKCADDAKLGLWDSEREVAA